MFSPCSPLPPVLPYLIYQHLRKRRYFHLRIQSSFIGLPIKNVKYEGQACESRDELPSSTLSKVILSEQLLFHGTQMETKICKVRLFIFIHIKSLFVSSVSLVVISVLTNINHSFHFCISVIVFEISFMTC